MPSNLTITREFTDDEGNSVVEAVLTIPLPPVAEFTQYFSEYAIGVALPGYNFVVQEVDSCDF
jgi:hypothetical protein